VVISSRISKDRQHTDKKKENKRTNNDLQNTTQKTIDRTTQTTLKIRDDLRYPGTVSSSCSTIGIRRGNISRFLIFCLGALVSCWDFKRRFNYLTFQSFDYERTWWRLFKVQVVKVKIQVVMTELDIYVIIIRIRNRKYWEKHTDLLQVISNLYQKPT